MFGKECCAIFIEPNNGPPLPHHQKKGPNEPRTTLNYTLSGPYLRLRGVSLGVVLSSMIFTVPTLQQRQQHACTGADDEEAPSPFWARGTLQEPRGFGWLLVKVLGSKTISIIGLVRNFQSNKISGPSRCGILHFRRSHMLSEPRLLDRRGALRQDVQGKQGFRQNGLTNRLGSDVGSVLHLRSC